ncbi:hypothetical protein KIW84_010137 [Lathyrus oleraceus]|uniref:DUF4283 domain-containing protein n=1 Tax=Pisum sativum TaxID=3888 RepID=A0A9D4YK11_PEA|nr:hypothetical protein KIW84_010137 [Pisum sativum]
METWDELDDEKDLDREPEEANFALMAFTLSDPESGSGSGSESDIEDWRVRPISTWNLNLGLLKLFPWTKDFNPCLLKNSSAQVWIRIHGLPQEYWRPKIVFVIASSIGIPLCTDSASSKGCFDWTFGHYVRVLVDLELTKELSYKVLVERKGFAFFVELKCKNLSKFCSNCNMIMNSVNNCKRIEEEGGKGMAKGNQKRRGDDVVMEDDKGNDFKGSIKAYVLRNDVENMDAFDEDSSFVENTKIINKIVDLNTIVQVQQNLDFLNSSWANMVEQEDVRQGISDGDNVQGTGLVDSEGFQKVRSKSIMKAHKKSVARSNYITRYFNIILGAHKYCGSNSPTIGPMEDFRRWTDDNHLLNIPITDARYTWSNGRRGISLTQKRLDKAVCNQEWIDSCVKLACSTFLKNRLDHFPLLLQFSCQDESYMSQFKFLNMWSSHSECQNVVDSVCNTEVVRCPMFVLTKKLQILKDRLKAWNVSCFENVLDKVIQAEKDLKDVQEIIVTDGHSENLTALEKKVQVSLD